MNARPMTPAQAADYTPQWGSYVRDGDAGACMYGNPAEPETARLMAAHVRAVCLPFALEREAAGDSEYDGDAERLESLLAYLDSVAAVKDSETGRP